MSFNERLTDFSKGDDLRRFWRLYYRRERTQNRLMRRLLTFLINRCAHRHGGYVGNGAKIAAVPSLPHGLHGVYISRYATLGAGCRIYQNVTIGEVEGKAPVIGDNCLIGAGAAIIGDIRVGSNVRIGAGAIVTTDVPDNATVVSQPARIIIRGDRNG